MALDSIRHKAGEEIAIDSKRRTSRNSRFFRAFQDHGAETT
jgi:hypothetical protein